MHNEGIEEYIEDWGEPILRFSIKDSYKNHTINNIPFECCVFKVDLPPHVMVVSRYINDKWIANEGSRSVIAFLIDRLMESK